MPFCSNCGTPFDEGTRFCAECGQPAVAFKQEINSGIKNFRFILDYLCFIFL